MGVNNSSGVGEVLSLLRGGNVGLGVTTPATKLHLFGSAYARFQSGSGTSDLWDIGVDDTTQRIRFLNSTSGAGEVLSLSRTGYVGIGTTAPAARFHVAGDIKVDGNINAKFQDVAEWVDSVEPLEAGTVVVIDATGVNRVSAASRAYDSRVAGAISAQPGLVLGEPGAGRALVAQSGRVRVKVDARYGAIRAGDLLVTSPTKGHAMRSRPTRNGTVWMHRPGTLIGKALEPLPKGKGEILVLLTLQ